MHFHKITSISRDAAAIEFASGNSDRICQALVKLAFFEGDWRYVQDLCLRFLGAGHLDVRSAAVTCLGHLARIHKQLDVNVVTNALSKAKHDELLKGQIDDALDDISRYLKPESPEHSI